MGSGISITGLKGHWSDYRHYNWDIHGEIVQKKVLWIHPPPYLRSKNGPPKPDPISTLRKTGDYCEAPFLDPLGGLGIKISMGDVYLQRSSAGAFRL